MTICLVKNDEFRKDKFLSGGGASAEGYDSWAEYALAGRFTMVSLPHIRSVLTEARSYRAALDQLRGDVILQGGSDPVDIASGGGGVSGGPGHGKKRKRKPKGGARNEQSLP